ncbi:HU family DNA-binding protein [Psychrobacter sp. AOP31-A1-22]|uniref:HU family DNA-binding protein n=1 Tax=Psychrobacter sp. AOP31-A1-22 TaxID=3457696 RepID=UPI004036C2FF
MNKSELVSSMAKKAGTTQKEARLLLEAFQDSLVEAMVADDKLMLVGFGTFSVIEKNARVGRNPKTGEAVHIPAKRTIKLKVSDKLNEQL